MTITEFFELVGTLAEKCNGEFPIEVTNSRLQYEIVTDYDRHDEVLELLLSINEENFIATYLKHIPDITTTYRNRTYKLIDVNSACGVFENGTINGNKVRWYLTFKRI